MACLGNRKHRGLGILYWWTFKERWRICLLDSRGIAISCITRGGCIRSCLHNPMVFKRIFKHRSDVNTPLVRDVSQSQRNSMIIWFVPSSASMVPKYLAPSVDVGATRRNTKLVAYQCGKSHPPRTCSPYVGNSVLSDEFVTSFYPWLLHVSSF